MIKFHCLNKTTKYHEETKLTIRLRDGGKNDFSYTTDIRIISSVFDFSNHGYLLKATRDYPSRLMVNEKINQTKEMMLDLYLENKHLSLSNKDFRKLLDKTIRQKEERLNKSQSCFADELDKYIDTLYTTDERREAFKSVARSFRRFEQFSSIDSPTVHTYKFCDLNAELLGEYRMYLHKEHIYDKEFPKFFRSMSNK